MSLTANVSVAMKAAHVVPAWSKVIANFGMRRVAGASAIPKNFGNVPPDLSMTLSTRAGRRNLFHYSKRMQNPMNG